MPREKHPGPRMVQLVRAVPCDCPGGLCGFQHVVRRGPRRFFLDGRAVSEAEYSSAMRRAGEGA